MTLGIVLAAGRSSRMGTPKAALPFEGTTIVQAVVSTLYGGGCDAVRVVLGHHAASVAPLLLHSRAEVVLNPEPDLGMISSVHTGVRRDEAVVSRWLVHPVDMPFVSVDTVREMLAASRRFPDAVLVACCGGRRGHPILIPRGPALHVLQTAERLSDLLHQEAVPVEEIETGDPGVLRDIDTPEDLEQVLGTDAKDATER